MTKKPSLLETQNTNIKNIKKGISFDKKKKKKKLYETIIAKKAEEVEAKLQKEREMIK